MTEIFRTPFSAEQPSALAVHCSDPRYQMHFHEFLRQHAGLERYALIAVPGGPQFLTLTDLLPKFSWAGWRWMKFMVDIAKPRRVILIGHDDCRWYIDGHFWQYRHKVRDRQVEDLRKVKADITKRFGQITVELYFARVEDDHVVFDSVV